MSTVTNKRAGFVYVLYDTYKRQYKIGKAKDVQTRLRQLQTGNPELVILYFKWYEDSYTAETALHNLFAAYRKKKEFFELDRQSKVLLEKIFDRTLATTEEKERLDRLRL